MEVENILKKKIEEYLSKKYSISKTKIEILKTRKEFKGDYTVILFPLIPLVKKKPVEFGDELGNFIKENESFIQEFNIVQGFLNLIFIDSFLIDILGKILDWGI